MPVYRFTSFRFSSLVKYPVYLGRLIVVSFSFKKKKKKRQSDFSVLVVQQLASESETIEMADTGKDYISNSADPKSIQDLTSFVSNFHCLFITFRNYLQCQVWAALL